MASDLGLHCLPMSHKKDARLIWVNYVQFVLQIKLFYKSVSMLTKCIILQNFDILIVTYKVDGVKR